MSARPPLSPSQGGVKPFAFRRLIPGSVGRSGEDSSEPTPWLSGGAALRAIGYTILGQGAQRRKGSLVQELHLAEA